MKKTTSSVLIIGSLVGVSLLFQVGCFSKEAGQNEYLGNEKIPEGILGTEVSLQSEVVREVVGNEAGAKVARNWRDVPGLKNKFQELFTKYFVTNKGEETERARLKAVTLKMKATNNWNRISGALEVLENAGMATSEFTATAFLGVEVGEYHPIANILNRQITNFRDWETKREGDSYQFPISKFHDYPLDFPPEMYFAEASGNPSNNDWDLSLLEQAAEIRDRSIRSYSKLMEERSIMLGSAYAALNDLSVEIPLGEMNDALAELSPYYMELERKIEEVKLQYSQSLASLFSSSGN